MVKSVKVISPDACHRSSNACCVRKPLSSQGSEIRQSATDGTQRRLSDDTLAESIGTRGVLNEQNCVCVPKGPQFSCLQVLTKASFRRPPKTGIPYLPGIVSPPRGETSLPRCAGRAKRNENASLQASLQLAFRSFSGR